MGTRRHAADAGHGFAGVVGARRCRLLAIAALGFATTCHGATNLLTNPGFESGAPFGTGSNWTVAGENQLLDCGQAHSGSCSLRSSQSAAVAQSTTLQFVDTLLGQEYELSFAYMRHRNALLTPVNGSFQVLSGDVGSFVTVLAGDLVGDTTWAGAGGRFLAAGPLTRVSIRGEDFELNAMNFDGFVLTAVPEPHSAAMLLAGLAVVTAAVRRRSRAAARPRR
jgi:hypothetical protein